jgi:hypothetical protein
MLFKIILHMPKPYPSLDKVAAIILSYYRS